MDNLNWLDAIIAEQQESHRQAGIDETFFADAAEYTELDEVEDANAVNIERH